MKLDHLRTFPSSVRITDAQTALVKLFRSAEMELFRSRSVDDNSTVILRKKSKQTIRCAEPDQRKHWGNYVLAKKPLFVALLCLLLSSASAFAVVQDEPRASSETILPAWTTAWVSIPDVYQLKTAFDDTNIGRLANNSDMQPFFDSISEQLRDWANKKNLRLGLTVDDLNDLQTGEICIAGILPLGADQKAVEGRGSHGLVLLVDVSESEEEALELIKKVGQKMDEAGAKKVEMKPIHGADVAKWKWVHKNPINGAAVSRTTLQTITNGWLLACDNEAIFRDVLLRINPPNGVAVENKLSDQPAFMKIAKETKIDGATPHIRWFLDPFGYMKLADAIAAEDKQFRQRKDDIGEILESQGFDAIKGVGGIVSFANSERDVTYRVFVHTPPRNVGAAQKRARGILDFRNKWNHDLLVPEEWVASNGSAYSTFTWDVDSAFKNIGEVFDAFVSPEEDGDWDRFVNGFNEDLDFDLRKFVAKLGNRFSVMSALEYPIELRSERVVIGVHVKEDLEEVFDMVRKMVGADGDVIDEGDRKIIVVDTTSDDDEGLSIEENPVFGGDDEEEEGQEEVDSFNLFEKRYFATLPNSNGKGGHILICNDLDYLISVLDSVGLNGRANMQDAEDFVRVGSVLSKLVDMEKLSVKQFGRLDKIFEGNYEMMRQGKMAQSQTVLARVLNQIFTQPDAAEDFQRQQQIDGSKLPEDYAKSVAPFLGPAGWGMETKEDGWLITGVVLKKNGVNEVVRKQDEVEKSRR